MHIPSDEWAIRFGWVKNEDGDRRVLDDQDIAMLLRRIGVAYVWSQQDRGDGGHEIVAGMTPTANGYYLCNSPRTTPDDEKIVAVIPPIEHESRGRARGRGLIRSYAAPGTLLGAHPTSR